VAFNEHWITKSQRELHRYEPVSIEVLALVVVVEVEVVVVVVEEVEWQSCEN
jgi:hypothetical protein